MTFINYAIDLGTTNSLIAKNDDGKIKVYKNPKGFRESLPSVVAFRKSGILIGDKAKELKDRDQKNVISSFKRKMGTDATYFVEELNDFVNPITLSTYILNELKTFVREEVPLRAVITIPASFDTIQSNATKQAGLDAGFKEVVLLQEPIAACLSVFNENSKETKSGKWIIYDLGGGTFDVAIVSANNEELKVIDHQGNNFLGGLDFDIAIVKSMMIPQIAKQGKFDKLLLNINENPDSIDYLHIYNYLAFYAEQLKIELSTFPTASIEFQLADDDGIEQEITITVAVEQFNDLIAPQLMHTINLLNELLKDNNISIDNLEELVLVGGSTYIPFVRTLLERELKIKVNQKVDPTNAIVIGAAYYAGNKASKYVHEEKSDKILENNIVLKPIYERQSREDSELVILKSSGEIEGKYYRVYRDDLAYDSGKKILSANEKFSLPLTAHSTNIFTIELYDHTGSLIDSNAAQIQISQGLFVIDGQPLPHDICIEVDDVENRLTVLEAVFDKNALLPLNKTIYKMIARDMLESGNDSLVINILEGDKNANPSTNQVIGCITISPKDLGQNLFKDSDVGITLSISESRDLTVTASISQIDLEIKNVFSPTQKLVNLDKLREEFRFLSHCISRDLADALSVENFEQASELQLLQEECNEGLAKIKHSGNIESDVKFYCDELKRKIAVRYDKFLKKTTLLYHIDEYRYEKENVSYLMNETDFPEKLKFSYLEIVKSEKSAINDGNITFIKGLKSRLKKIAWEYNKTSIKYMKSVYFSYRLTDLSCFKDPKEAERIMDIGNSYLDKNSVTAGEYLQIISKLYYLLKPEYQSGNENDTGFDLKGTGLR